MVGKPVPQKPAAPADAATSPKPGPSEPKSGDEKTYALSNRNVPSQVAAAALTAAQIPRELRAAKREADALAKASARLVSLDAFRGFIMMMLAANGFGLLAFSRISEQSPVWQEHDRELWQNIGFHFDHPAWMSSFDIFKVSFWDLIQPSFMFMVGVAMPFSYVRRESQGQSQVARTLHALIRSMVLILLGVFLSSIGHDRTTWVFPNVLCQIGLGYFIASLLLNRGRVVQFAALATILIGYWGWFYFNPPPVNYDYDSVNASKDKGEILEGSFAAWSKNANAAFLVDQWLLPKLRSAPETPDESAAVVALESEWRLAALVRQDSGKTSAGDSPEGAALDTAAADSHAVTPVPAATDPAATDPAATDPEIGVTETPPVAAPSETGSPIPAGDAKSEIEDAAPSEPAWFRRWFFSNTEPYKPNAGGYTTFNFIPSIATMLLGILCGQLLIAPSLSRWSKLGMLVAAAAVCLGLGIAADLTVCPVVKRIWTPSWVLFSGGYVIGMLALFYLLFDIAPLKFLAFPLVVVGMNSILTYMLGQTVSGWMRESVVQVHLAGIIDSVFGTKALDPQWYGPITLPSVVFLLYWLFLLWLYRQRIFLRI